MEFEGPVLFFLGRLPVTAYALCMVLAAGAGMLLFFHLGKKKRLNTDAMWRTALLALPLGLLGARLFYCGVRLYLYLEIGLDAVLRLWEGGYALWGAMGGVALAGVIGAKSAKQPVSAVLDALAAPGALVIALGRFAEFFSGEGYGPYVEIEAFQRFPFAVFDSYYEEWNWAVFMLEGLAALIIMAVLLRKTRKAGNTARLFLLLYSACQITLEALRRDSYLRWLFVRASQLTAAVMIALIMVFGVIRWLLRREERLRGPGFIALCWGGVLSCAGLCVALGFAADDKIWQALPLWGNYVLLACASACMGAVAYQVAFRLVKE